MGQIRQDLIERALRCALREDTLRGLLCRGVLKKDGCYDINDIRNAIDRYQTGAITQSYFKLWCACYAKALRDSYPLRKREDLAFDHIAECLLALANGNITADAASEEIARHNAVIEGEAEADYWIASDTEVFYVEIGAGYDEIRIDHRKRTFDLTYGIKKIFDEVDGLGDCVSCEAVNRAVFDAIVMGLERVGYRGSRKKRRRKNAKNEFDTEGNE